MQSWRNFGPSVSYSDGDAEFFRTTDRLAQQYPGFAPTPDAPVQQQQQEVVSEPEEQAGPGPSSSSQLLAPGRVARRSEFGLSPKQIQALGLAGPRVNTPDSVRSSGSTQQIIVVRCNFCGIMLSGGIMSMKLGSAKPLTAAGCSQPYLHATTCEETSLSQQLLGWLQLV
jgi:hypothetical protein